MGQQASTPMEARPCADLGIADSEAQPATTRIYAMSDIHTDFAANMEWVQALDDHAYQRVLDGLTTADLRVLG